MWTVGHVLTHLARNAESHVRMLEGATMGEALEQYAGGYDQRAADIEAGADRSAHVLESEGPSPRRSRRVPTTEPEGRPPQALRPARRARF